MPCKAEPAPGAAQLHPPADIASEARRHFEAAIAHYRGRRFREAIHEFELSLEKIPSPDVWFNIARAHEQLGEFRLAAEGYRHYLRERPDAADGAALTAHVAALTKQAETHATTVQRGADLGSLAIDAEQPGARVSLDGRELGFAPVDRILEVSPGQHRLEASMRGFIPFRAQIEVQPGALSAAYVDLRPLADRRSRTGIALGTWLCAGASAAGIAAAGAFGVVALAADERGDGSASERWARASDWALGSALVFGVTAAIVHLATHDEDSARQPMSRVSNPASVPTAVISR